MNRIRFSVYVVVFLISSIMGLVTANGISHFLDQSLVPVMVSKQPEQQNILIIHVDDLQSGTPQLVSAWTMFSVANNQHFITLKSLYPVSVPDPMLSQLSDTFALSSKNKPSKEFFNALKVYQIEWDGYILIDNQGILDLHRWLVGNPTVTLNDNPTPQTDLILQEETLLFNGICHGIIRAGLQPGDTVQWQTIFPQHLQTSLSTKELKAQWQRITELSAPPICNVYTN